MRVEPVVLGGGVYLHVVVLDVDTCRCKYRIVERTEGIEVFGVDFGSTVAAHQMVLEEDTYFRDNGTATGMMGGGYLNAGHEVFLAIGAQYANGQLRTGEDDRFVEPFEHETECRSCIGHGVGAMKDNETGVAVVIVADDAYQPAPGFGVHVRGVHGRIELVGVDGEGKFVQFGYMLL